MVEKAVDVEAKGNLQPSSKTREIDSRCPKGYSPLFKKNKDNAYWEHHNEVSYKDKEKAKSHNPSSTNQPETQTSKKRQKCRQGGYLATRVNATEVAKKDQDKAKEMSHVKCYTCKQKGHYINKCPKKSKN